MNYKPLLFAFFLLIDLHVTNAQHAIQEVFRMQSRPMTYAVNRTNLPVNIDGQANEDAWKIATWTDSFVDIRGVDFPNPAHDTRVKMIWDNAFLYVYAELKEPHLWATLNQRDTIIYHDNDFELFIKNEHREPYYFEIEVNAKNTLFDLLMSRPYRFGGHALIHWDVRHIQSAIYFKGTLNNPTDIDSYWAIEMAIPFESLSRFGKKSTPKINEYWQFNFSRVQWQHRVEDDRYIKKTDTNNKALEEDNWVWSPIGIVNMHYPERWGYIQFVDNVQQVDLPPYYAMEKLAWNIFYLQQIRKQKTKQYTSNLTELEGYTQLLAEPLKNYAFKIECSADKSFYRMIIHDTLHQRQFILDSNGNYNTNYE